MTVVGVLYFEHLARVCDDERCVLAHQRHLTAINRVSKTDSIMLSTSFARMHRSLRRWNNSSRTSPTCTAYYEASTISCRAYSVMGDDDDVYAVEEISQTGEWAGCKRSFMAPLLIPTRGSETLYNRESVCCVLTRCCWLRPSLTLTRRSSALQLYITL